MTQHHPDTAGQVRTALSEFFGLPLDRLGDEARLIEDIGADSLDCIEVAMEIEERFEIEVIDEDMDAIVTVGDLINLVSDALAEKVA